jgi:hypothetical protein
MMPEEKRRRYKVGPFWELLAVLAVAVVLLAAFKWAWI